MISKVLPYLGPEILILIIIILISIVTTFLPIMLWFIKRWINNIDNKMVNFETRFSQLDTEVKVTSSRCTQILDSIHTHEKSNFKKFEEIHRTLENTNMDLKKQQRDMHILSKQSIKLESQLESTKKSVERNCKKINRLQPKTT